MNLNEILFAICESRKKIRGYTLKKTNVSRIAYIV